MVFKNQKKEDVVKCNSWHLEGGAISQYERKI